MRQDLLARVASVAVKCRLRSRTLYDEFLMDLGYLRRKPVDEPIGAGIARDLVAGDLGVALVLPPEDVLPFVEEAWSDREAALVQFIEWFETATSDGSHGERERISRMLEWFETKVMKKCSVVAPSPARTATAPSSSSGTKRHTPAPAAESEKEPTA